MHVVPLTSTLREFHSEITIEPDDHNGLTARSAAQCQHLRRGINRAYRCYSRQRRGHDARSNPGDGRSHARHPYLTSTNTLKEFTKDGTPLSKNTKGRLPWSMGEDTQMKYSALLIAKLALHETLQHEGLGSQLLVDALTRAVHAVEIAAGRYVVVDAIDDRAENF